MSGDQPASGQRTASAPAGDPEPTNADRAGHAAQAPKAFIAADDRGQLGGPAPWRCLSPAKEKT
jgi:hypothetical protein